MHEHAALHLLFRKRTMKKITLTFLALLPLSVLAQQPQVDPCITKTTTQEMNSCAKDEYDKANTKLDQTYKALLKQIPAKDEDGIPYTAVKKQMPVAHKAWTEFVKQDCKAIAIYNKGSALKDVELYSCMRLHTEQRISDLDRFLTRRNKPQS
jgi:uncharacterized protein YecT (DUF1311 family)